MKGSSIKKIRKGLKYIVAIGFFVLLSFSFSKDTKKLSLASFEENDGIQQLQKEGRVQLANVSESQPFPDYEYWTGMYGYAYELNNDGDNTITLTGMIPTNYSDYHRLGHHTSAYHHSGTQNIEIPSIYSIYDSKGNRTDYTVTRIASNFTTRYIVGNCYYGCRSYNVVNPAVLKLPASLKRIEDNAFAENFLQITTDFTSHGFDKTTFDLSECVNLEYIGKNAFYTSSEDNERNIGQIAEFMPKLVEVGANAFRNAFRTDYDTNDNINMSNVISIGSYAFANDITLSSGYSYSALRGVNFGSSLESLGDYAFYNCDGLENVDVPETCTRVGDYAFASCQNMIMATVRTPMLGIGAFKDDASLVSVRLSDNTESIPDFCFQSCNSLSTVSLYPSYTDISESLALKRIGVNAFSNTNLNTFKLPKNVNEIGDSAFADCRGLLVFDFSLASEQIDLGDNVLKGCSNLEDITIPGDLFNSCGIDFLRDATLLSSVTFLRKNVLEPGFFAGCSNLTTVNFAEEDPITNIPKEYFKDCVKLSNLSIVDVSNNRHGELSRSIGNIGEYAFYNTAFESITITNAVNSVGSFAFANMQALTYASVNSKDLSYRMFYGCPYLNTLYVGPNTSNVLKEAEENISTYVFDYTTKSETIVNKTVEKNAAFANCVRLENITLECPTLGAYMFDGCMALKEIELKATIRTIETHAFANCQELHQVTLLTSALGEFMFANDTKLKNITLNSNTTTIPTHAFYRSNLENISIPSSVTTVGNLAFAYSLSLKTVDLNDSKMVSPYMFYNCIALQEITIPESVQDNVGEYAFANCATLKYATILNTKISDYMFYNDPLLFAPSTSNQTLVVDSHVTSVGEHAFAKTGVTKAEIGSNQISDYMFEDCENLQELVIGIINSDGILSVPTDIGEYSFKGCNYLSRVTLNLKKIGAHMFEGCTSLTTLTLGSPIERIEEYAFANCTSLSTVSTNALKNLIEIEQYAFANCINLDSFTVPDSVITMGLGVFSNCASLNTITLPFAGESLYDVSTNPEVPSEKTLFGWIFGTVASDSSVNITSKYSASASASYYIPTGLNNVIITKETTVLYGTFYGCTMLQSINIPTDTERIESYAFYGCTGLTNFTVPSTVTELGSYVLAECRNLREATLHCNIMGTFMFYNCVNLNTTHLKNVQYVSTSAYEGCISLEIVDLNQGNGNEGYICTSINSKAFSGCINLSTIEFPSTIETIGASAFENCEKLSFITLPSSLTTLDSNAFKNCDSLVSIVIPKNLTDLGESIFVDCDGLLSILFTNKIVGEKMFESCNTIQIVDFQDVEEIGAFAFNECTSLEQLILPKTLKKLGEKAFYHCASIEEVIIPASVVQIDSAVFQNCTNLKYATLLNGKMGTSMFRNCTSLRNVCFEAAEDYPSYSIASYAFYGCHELLFPELPSNITAIGDYAFAQNYRNTRIELPKTIQSLGMNVFWDVNVEELVIPFIGAGRTPSYDPTVKGYSRYTLGWIFGASTPVLNSYGVYIVASGTPYSNASDSYQCIANYQNSAYSGWYKTEKWYLPTSLKKVVVTDATIIPYFAFWSARYITDIEISDTVQTIREGSMYNCTSLKSLTVPFIGISRGATGIQKSSLFFYDQTGNFHAGTLAAWFLSMPGGYHDASVSNDYDTKTPETTVTAHGLTVAYVASYSRRVSYKVPLSLKNVTVKDLKNNTSIGLEEAAFYNCSMIENIEIIGHLTKIGKNAFYNTGITSFDIASTVTEMGEGAFSGTKSLVDVTIRSSIISKGMFKNSSTLKHVEILGENVVIQDQAFMNCTALQEMNFNQSVSSVGNEILAGCTALQDLYINMLGANTTGNTVTGSTNFGFLFGKTGGTGLVENTIQIDANTTEIRYIPADVTLHFIGSVIPSYAFAGVSSLKKVVLHEGVREIGDYAFLDTTNLEEVRIPSSLEDCGIYVFKNSGLVTAYFGEGIETIYEGMFANCSNLTNLIFESTTTTYEYRYVDHNVFEEYKKVGANGSFLSTGKYVSGGKDLTIGTEDDIENVIRSEEFYIDNQDGTFYAYGKDTLLGTDDDILVGIGNDHSFGTADDFVIEVIQGKFYKNFLNNTYCTVTMQQDVDGNWNYAFGSTRYALVNGELVEAVVDQKENVYISIPSADYILFQSVGRDGLLGTEDDLIAFLGVKSTSYTVITDAILYENVLVHDNKLYVDYQDNTYQEIMTDTTSYTLGELFCAGADCVIGTEDDISKYATITYDQIQTNPELKDYGKLILLDQEFTYERLITGEDGTHYIYLPWAAFLNEPSYLGFGRDGKLGTNDDVLGMTTSFNPKYTPVEEEPVQIPLVNTNSYIRYENKLYENNVMANTVKHIESEAFINCTGLENLTLSSQLETIDDKAFFRSGLVEITVPSSVDAIGKYVFAENNNLELATVKCVVLGEYMFSEDKKLRKVSIAYSTQVISKGAFNKCTALKLVTFHSNFIQDIHYELPNGYFPDGDQPADGTGSGSEDPLPDADEYVTYLVAQAKKSAITIQSGLDGIEGTADDYYSYGSYYKLIGADLVAQTKDDIVVLIYEGSYYEVVGYDKLSKTINLYRKVTWNSASNSFVYGSYFLGDINGEFSLANQNNRIVVQEDALGNYTYQVGNIHYSYGADGKLGTLDDIKTVTINGVTYTIEEIEGAYYTSLAKNIYYEVDVHNLSLKLVYLTETGFVDTITSVQNSYYFVHENHTLSRIVNGEIEETIYIPYNNTLIEVEERTENVFYENLSGNFYNRWEYNNTQFTSRLICILEDEEKEATYLRGNNTYAVYVDNHVYRVPGDDLILGTEDDSYIVHDRPSENVGGLVFILRTEDGNYYHYHNFNIYFKLDLSKNEYSYVCAGPDGDPTTTHDNNTNIVIGNDGAFYIDNQNGTYYAISGNTLTGTDQDRLVCSANGTQIGNPSDYTLTKYGTDYYRDYLDNTYQQVILTKNGNQWTSSLVGDRFVGTSSGTVDPTLTPQIVVTNDNGFVYIDHHNGTFTQLGADGKFNTSDDTLHLLMDNQKADVNDPMVVAGTYTPEGSGPKTFYYEDLGHNVFRKYEITGSYGSYVYTDLGFIAARNDGKPGNVNDVEAFYNEALQAYYYIDSNSARRGYGLDGLLYGSNRNQDSTYIMYNGKDVDVTSYTLDGTAGLYHINGDNTYTKYRLLDSLVDGNTHEVESIICLGTNQTLDISDSTDVVEVIVNGVATRFLYKNGEETYIAAGADGLLGYGDDDVLCHLGANNRIDYTNAGSDDILDVVAGVTTASYYKLVAGNIYQRIENGVLASFVAAGKTNGVYHIGSVDDLVAKEADVLRVTTEYVEFMYNNFLLATENGIISLYESQMVHTNTIADASSYVIVQRGRDNTYHTADDYMVIEGVATFAQEDGLLGSSDDLMNVVAGLDEMPYAYDAVKQIYYTFVLSGNRFEEKLDAEGHREAVYAPTHVGSATDKALLALSIAGKTQYYLANDAKTYYTYSDGSILQYLVHVGLDDTGSPATLGSIYNYAVVGQTALFAGADGLIGTADDITAFVGGTDERAYGYVDTVDHNIYVKFDLSTGNRIHKDDGSLLIISAGSDRLIGTADDIDTVVLINGHYYYSIGDAYFTSPTHMLGYSDMQMYAGADGEIGTIDDYYNVTRYLVNGAGYRATFVGPDGYYGGNDDLIAVLGTDSYAYYALTDSVFEKYNNIYQRYAMTSTGYTDKIGDLICGGVNCRPGDADDITQASGNLVLAVNGDWYIVIEENKEYLNKSFDGLLGTEDDKHVFVGEDAILGTYDDYYWISIDNYDRKVFPGQTPFEEGDSDEVKEWKKFHGDDIFFTADDYYSVPSEAIVEVDNKVPFELVTIDDYAFFECSSLEEFQLYSPDDFNTYQNLETLGSYAFAGCTSLVSIILPYTLQGDKLIHGTGYGVYIFEDCTSLSTVTFNETYLNHATFIPKGMFKGCVSLHELYFYDSLTKLDVNVFSPSITEVREEAFMNTWVSTDSSDPEIGVIELPAACLKIGEHAFYNSDITTAYLRAESQIEFGIEVFQNSKIEHVEFTFISEFSERIFDNCIYLSTVIIYENGVKGADNTLSSDVRRIEKQAFRNTQNV